MLYEEKPKLEELPTLAQLLRASIVAIATAIVLAVAVVLPAEHGIDPTGAGRFLGLTEMGEIKKELSEEAQQDHQSSVPKAQTYSLFAGLSSLFISKAYAQSDETWRDETTFVLEPGDTHEFKMTMKKGDVAKFLMVVEGGRVNFDLHAHGGGNSITYEKGRGSQGGEGQFEAAFDGNHGWFWRNRDDKTATVTLKVGGTYSAINQ